MSIEHHAVGKKHNVETTLRRAKRKRYPEIEKIEDIDNPAKRAKLEEYTFTISGHLTSQDDKLIRFYNAKFIIFMSNNQIKWFKYALEIFGDGTFCCCQSIQNCFWKKGQENQSMFFSYKEGFDYKSWLFACQNIVQE